MRAVIFGGSGGLGSQLSRMMGDMDVTALSSKDVDITDDYAVYKFFRDHSPDVLINMAVVNHDAPIHKLENDWVMDQLEANVAGTLSILRHALPGMRERKFGRIILVSSILSHRPVPGTAVYSGCKAFIDNLVKTCALENAKYGVTCNSIVLGYSDGGLTYTIPKEFLEKVVSDIPMKRLCRVDEIHRAVRFLIDTEYATGTNLVLAGGLL